MHPTSSLLSFLKRKDRPLSADVYCPTPASPRSCPTRSFPNMPLAPSYESVYTTLAHNRRTTSATRPAPRNESCVACVSGTPGSLNTRTPSFLQVSRTSDACYLRLVSKDTQWSRWRCPTGLLITPDRRVERKSEEEEKWTEELFHVISQQKNRENARRLHISVC